MRCILIQILLKVDRQFAHSFLNRLDFFPLVFGQMQAIPLSFPYRLLYVAVQFRGQLLSLRGFTEVHKLLSITFEWQVCTFCPGSSDPILYSKLLYKTGHYFMDIQYVGNIDPDPRAPQQKNGTDPTGNDQKLKPNFLGH